MIDARTAPTPGTRTGGGPTVMEALFVLSVCGAGLLSALAALLPARTAAPPPAARPPARDDARDDGRGPDAAP